MVTVKAFERYRLQVMDWMNVTELSEDDERHIRLGWNRDYLARRTASEILDMHSRCSCCRKCGGPTHADVCITCSMNDKQEERDSAW